MPANATAKKILMITAVAALVFQTARAQTGNTKPNPAPAPGSDAGTSDRVKTLRAAADALGMVRWSDIGAGNIRLPGVDVITTMEFWGSGTASGAGQAGGSRTPAKVEYHAALSYNPPSMRVELTRSDGPAQHTFQVVREKYAWDESELGGGLVPGKGTATPAMAAVRERLLQLWILPYGVVKSALAAGDKTTVSTENGATVITFPMSGQLAGLTMKATLDSKNLISKVETRADNPALKDLAIEAEYSDYADHGEILTDIKSPGHIVQNRAGMPVLDLQMKTVDGNNPYLVFPVPMTVKAAAEGSAPVTQSGKRD